jgi:hypothetical protein
MLAIFVAFLLLGAVGCKIDPRVTTRSLYYTVTVGGLRLEVRLDQMYERVFTDFSKPRWRLRRQTLFLRDRSTGEFRPATPKELDEILGLLFIPEFIAPDAYPARPMGPTDGIMPKPTPAPKPSDDG